MAEDTKPADTTAPATDPLTIAALQAQIADLHNKVNALTEDNAALRRDLQEGPLGQQTAAIAALSDTTGQLFAIAGKRFAELEAALVPIAAVAVEVWPNVCYSDPGGQQAKIRETMPAINLRVAKSPHMQTAARPRVVPGEQFDHSRPDGSVMHAPDRSTPNYAPANYSPGPAPRRRDTEVPRDADDGEGELGQTTDE